MLERGWISMRTERDFAKWRPVLAICLILILGTSCRQQSTVRRPAEVKPTPSFAGPLPQKASPQLEQVVEAAIEQTKVTTGYDPAYVGIAYPNGDVSSDTGVCSDVVVRAFRKAGIDLQKEVHEDMTRARAIYPKRWGASVTDTNIDHRRVLNLMTYFDRQGKSVPVTAERADYVPGDVISWELSDGVEHIGILTNLWYEPEKHFLIVHNIGAGARIEDVLFSWKIIGHYRYF